MYAAQPDLSACSQEQLLQQLLLADRYGVPKVLAAAAAAFSSINTAYLQWDVVLALYALPPGCTELSFCQPLVAAAEQKLQQELGDRELVWADDRKAHVLLSLPQPVLLQLLKDPSTRVASENTVFYTIERWWEARTALSQAQSASSESLRQAAALLELVSIKVCDSVMSNHSDC
jgi:hypothetical protein